MAGVEYCDGVKWSYSGGYALYNLDSKYTTLSGLIGHVDGTYTKAGTLNVYFDGELAHAIAISPEMMPQELVLEVRGVRQLKMSLSGTSNARYAFANAVLV